MNKSTIALLVACSLMAIQLSSAATIPAGTTLIVRTNETVSSSASVGKTFAAHLDRDVVVGGTVLLRKGTKVNGRVESRRSVNSTPLILNVTQLASHGRLVSIKTVQGFRAQDNRFTTSRGVTVGSGGFFQLPAGTVMHFKLAQPVDMAGR